MTLQDEPGPAKAARHYRRAGEYYELAQGFLARASGDAGAADILVAAGGALLYEAAKQCVTPQAAKQCVNAVANLNGRDPQANHEKMAALRAIANTHPAYPNLIKGSRTAWDLHIHADQGNLALTDLASALEQTRQFIMDMRSIYRATAAA